MDEATGNHYWNVIQAEKKQVLSTILLFNVSLNQARSLRTYWEKLMEKENTPNYNRAFKNCATLCYEGYVNAGILHDNLFRRLYNSIMTPSRLYQALLEQYSKVNANLIARTGYIGMEPDGNNGNNRLILKEG